MNPIRAPKLPVCILALLRNLSYLLPTVFRRFVQLFCHEQAGAMLLLFVNTIVIVHCRSDFLIRWRYGAPSRKRPDRLEYRGHS